MSDIITVPGETNVEIKLHGAKFWTGDSGAPIYKKYGTAETSLLGLIKGNSLDEVCGCSIEMITTNYSDLTFVK